MLLVGWCNDNNKVVKCCCVVGWSDRLVGVGDNKVGVLVGRREVGVKG